MSDPTDTATRALAGREVLLCVTGGVAAYKAADLASKLLRANAALNVAMTEAAQRFVTPLTFQSLTRRRVFTSLWQATDDFSAQHLSLTEQAELMIVAPASADILAKLAGGIADDLVSTLALSAQGACPILIAPAMNTRMWEAPPTRRNLETLERWGVRRVGPSSGALACGTSGMGRMAEPDEILQVAAGILRAG